MYVYIYTRTYIQIHTKNGGGDLEWLSKKTRLAVCNKNKKRVKSRFHCCKNSIQEAAVRTQGALTRFARMNSLQSKKPPIC